MSSKLLKLLLFLGLLLGCIWLSHAGEPQTASQPALLAPLLGANGDSYSLAISDDGSMVLFSTTASNFEPNDFNGTAPDLFLYDRLKKETKLVTANKSNGGTANDGAINAMMTSEGGYVFYESQATDIVEGKTNRFGAIYMRDVQEGKTILISQGTNTQTRSIAPNGPSILSGITTDGSYVLFESNASNMHLSDPNFGTPDIFVRDVLKNTTLLAHATPTRIQTTPLQTLPWSYAFNGSMTADGRFVLFESGATNLVPRDTNAKEDIFLRDMVVKTNYLISHQFGGTNSAMSPQIQRLGSTQPKMNVDAKVIAFSSTATNLISPSFPGTGIYMRNMLDGTITQVPTPSTNTISGIQPLYTLSPDGRFLAYSYDSIIYLWDNKLQSNHTISILSNSMEGGASEPIPGITADGRADYPTFSKDGKVLAFKAAAFRRTILTIEAGLELTIQAVPSVATPVLSNDGKTIAFDSSASLVSEDKNRFHDVYVYNVETDKLEWISKPPQNPTATGDGGSVLKREGVSFDGSTIVFKSRAKDMVPNDTNGLSEVFLKNLNSGEIRLVSRNWDRTGTSSGNSTDPVIATDSNLVVFLSSGTNLVEKFQWSTSSPYQPYRYNLYLYDPQGDIVSLISTNAEGHGVGVANRTPIISKNGKFVLFKSASLELRNDSLRGEALFLYDVSSSTFQTIVLPSSTSVIEPVYVSNEGNVIYTRANELFIKDIGKNPLPIGKIFGQPAVAGDGTRLLFFDRSAGNNSMVFLDRIANLKTHFLPVTSTPKGTNEALRLTISEDGKLGAYVEETTPTPEIYMIGFQPIIGRWAPLYLNESTLTPAKEDSPMLSPDGRYLLFRYYGAYGRNDSVVGAQYYLKDRITGRSKLVSHLPENDKVANGRALNAFFSPDGRRIFFHSASPLLARSDSNAESDIFYVDIPEPDGDGDGMDDSWEMIYMETLEKSGWADEDLDGASNYDEFLMGTDPMNSDSIFEAQIIRDLFGGTKIGFVSHAANSYLVQYKENVQDPWINLSLPVRRSGNGPVLIEDNNGGGVTRFYRILMLR